MSLVRNVEIVQDSDTGDWEVWGEIGAVEASGNVIWREACLGDFSNVESAEARYPLARICAVPF